MLIEIYHIKRIDSGVANIKVDGYYRSASWQMYSNISPPSIHEEAVPIKHIDGPPAHERVFHPNGRSETSAAIRIDGSEAPRIRLSIAGRTDDAAGTDAHDYVA